MFDQRILDFLGEDAKHIYQYFSNGAVILIHAGNEHRFGEEKRKYNVAYLWYGFQKDYDDMNRKRQIKPDMAYIIIPDDFTVAEENTI